MILAWMGLALLSAAWLFAVGLFTEPNLTLSWLVEHFGGRWDHSFDPPLWPWLLGLGTLCLALSKVTLVGGRPSTGARQPSPPDRAPPPAVLPGSLISLIGLILCLPALFVMPWPYRAGPLLFATGMLLSFLLAVLRARSGKTDDSREPSRWIGSVLGRLASATLLAGGVWLIQGVVLDGYQAHTAYSHELPRPLAHVIGAAGRGLGIDLAVADTTIAMHSMRKIHLLGATWELLLDPTTLCLFAGGLVMLAWHCSTAGSPRGGLARWLFAALVLTLLFACWLPVRSGLYMALFLNDVLRIPYDSEIDSMRLFWDPLVHFAFLLPPVLLAWRFLPETGSRVREGEAPAEPSARSSLDKTRDVPTDHEERGNLSHVPARFGWAHAFGCLLAAAGVVLLTVAIVWAPVGEPRECRVVVEEYHPNPDDVWEKTWTPMDTEWYGQMSGYNYYCLYQYLTHYYPMERHRDAPLTEDSLSADDVLIIKVPTRPFSPPEVAAIVSFVERGGGLMLIGEHTNYQRSSTFMNPIARRFGFQFRTDNVYSMRGSVYEIEYEPALVPHPIMQHAQTQNFATPCSIEARPYSGRAVIRGRALKNLPADYHAYENFMPQPEDRAETRYGAFVQLWATQYGKGRVVAFTDSTVFSNFSAFEPDTAELMLGMIEWLRRRPPPVSPRPWLLIAGGGLLAAGVWLTRRPRGSWILIVAAGLCGWVVVVCGTRFWHAHAMPLPAERAQKADLPVEMRDKVDVVIDRTVCKTPLPVSGFIAGGADSFGLFERWILRLGYFTSRRDAQADDADVFGEEMLVFLNPDQPPDDAFLKRLNEYVTGGGKLLVVEPPLESRREPAGASSEREAELPFSPPSHVNRLLEPFKISVDHKQTLSGLLSAPDGWPQVPVDEALAVTGGTPFATVDGVAVGAACRHGKGVVVVVGFGNLFVDDNMGYSDQTEPDEDLRQVFELQYRLIREMVRPTGSFGDLDFEFQ